MKLKENLVSIILPVHNSEKFLAQCLESLLTQTYPDIQIIAIDDNSRDNSYKILKDFQKRYNGIEVYKNKKRYGLAICYNRGLKRAQGQFIAFTNPNDISMPNRFKRQVNFLTQNDRTVAVGTQYTRIDEENSKIERVSLPQEHETIYHNLLHTKSLYPETVMLNRFLVPKDFLYFKSNKYPLIFNEVFTKLFQYGKVANIGHSLYLHRVGLKRHHRKATNVDKLITTARLWLSSRSEHDYRPSIKSLVLPPLLNRFNS